MRKLVALLAGLIFTVHLASCTSNDSKDDSAGNEAVAEESATGTDGDLAALEGTPAESPAATESVNESFLDEQLPEEALGETKSTAVTEQAPPADSGSADLNMGETTPPPMMEEPKADALAAETTPPPAIESSPLDTTASVDTNTTPSFGGTETLGMESSSNSGMDKSFDPAPIAEEKPKASLKKIEAAPFTRNGVLLNSVYLARPKDNYNKISKLIYGDSKKSKELKKVNPSISSPRPGDKIYYNSPTRSTDDTKLLTFFEEMGMPPEVYVAQEGDDIKKVSKQLLGYENAWKEVWATNLGVESKGALAAGTELRYWKSLPTPAATTPPVDVAPATNVVPPPPMEGTPGMPAPGDMAMNQPMDQAPPMPDMPPPPDMAAQPGAANELPPPPTAEMAPPPPPPAAEMPPPPPPAEAVNPPPPPPIPQKNMNVAGGDEIDQDTMMTVGAAGIVLAALVLLIIIRKKRQSRDMANAFNDTQVGT